MSQSSTPKRRVPTCLRTQKRSATAIMARMVNE